MRVTASPDLAIRAGVPIHYTFFVVPTSPQGIQSSKPTAKETPIIYPDEYPSSPLLFDVDRFRARVEQQPKIFKTISGQRGKWHDALVSSEINEAVHIGTCTVGLLNLALTRKSGTMVFLDRSARPLRYLTFFLGRQLGVSNMPVLASMNVADQPPTVRPGSKVAEQLRGCLGPIDPTREILVADEVVSSGDNVRYSTSVLRAVFPRAAVVPVAALGGSDRTPRWYSERNYELGEKVGLIERPLPQDNGEISTFAARPASSRLDHGDVSADTLHANRLTVREFNQSLRFMAGVMAECTSAIGLQTQAQSGGSRITGASPSDGGLR